MSFYQFINEFRSESYLKLGDTGERVQILQQSLENLGFKLNKYGVDGKFGPETFGALQSTLNALAKLTNVVSIVGDPNLLNFAPDGITETQYNVAVMVGQKEEMASQIRAKLQSPDNTNNNNNIAMQSIIKENIPDALAFTQKLNEISNALSIDPNWLLLVMYKESKLKANAVNRNTGASGLIQFMPNTASGLGTTVEAIRQMSATQQLDLVYKYLYKWKGQMNSAIDVYMTVFYPAAVNKPDNFIIGSEKSPERAKDIAKRNPAISAGKPVIAKADFKSYVVKDVPEELAQYV